MKSFLKIFAVAASVIGLVENATAVGTLTLRLSDGVNSVTVVDGGANDSNPLPGVVTYNGSIGLNWTLNVTTGISKPVIGTPTQPVMDLNSVNATSRGAGTLTIMLTDSGFGPTSGRMTSRIGGTTQGKVTMNTYADAGNGVFALTTPLTSQGAFGTGVGTTAFSSTASVNLTGGLPFSLTEVATISHTKRAITSFNEELRVPDAGFTLALLGSSLIGLAAFARTRKTA